MVETLKILSLKVKSTFNPVTKNPRILTSQELVLEEIQALEQKAIPVWYNLNKLEHQILKQLSQRSDRIIKAANIGGAVVNWSRDKSIAEAYR